MWICFIGKVPAAVRAPRPLWFFPTPLARGAVGRTRLDTKLAPFAAFEAVSWLRRSGFCMPCLSSPGKSRAAGAGLLLRGGEKIGDVAVAVGYENSPHFSRAFKKFYGVSPKQYQSSGQDSN